MPPKLDPWTVEVVCARMEEDVGGMVEDWRRIVLDIRGGGELMVTATLEEVAACVVVTLTV